MELEESADKKVFFDPGSACSSNKPVNLQSQQSSITSLLVQPKDITHIKQKLLEIENQIKELKLIKSNENLPKEKKKLSSSDPQSTTTLENSLEIDYDIRITHATSLVPEIISICPFLELREEDNKVICSECQQNPANATNVTQGKFTIIFLMVLILEENMEEILQFLHLLVILRKY